MRKPRLFAIVKTKDGKLVKREVISNSSNYKLKDKYVKDIETGLYLKGKQCKKKNLPIPTIRLNNNKS